EGVGGVVAIFPIPGAKHVGKYGTKGIIKFGEFAADVSTNFVKNIKNKVVAKAPEPGKASNGMVIQEPMELIS
ncbi:MAG TPA: hypothetical protein GX497_03685, partial [Bacillus bacterium]|nr:hypothetical protein [Bacillus sp. (in: firmicutes)]